MAEGGGFEPPEAFTSTVFKTVAFVRSATLPPETIATRLRQAQWAGRVLGCCGSVDAIAKFSDPIGGLVLRVGHFLAQGMAMFAGGGVGPHELHFGVL